MRGRILAVAEAAAAGLIAGDDGRRYAYALTDLRSAAPRPGDAVDFQVDLRQDPPADPARAVGTACDVYRLPEAGPGATPAGLVPVRPKRDWANFYLSPNGRVALGDYWLYGFLVLFAVNVLVGWIPILGQIVSLVAGWAGIALAIKRCHDVNRSGWWSWLPFVPLLAGLAAIPLSVARADQAAIAVGVVCGLAFLAAVAWVFLCHPDPPGRPRTQPLRPATASHETLTSPVERDCRPSTIDPLAVGG